MTGSRIASSPEAAFVTLCTQEIDETTPGKLAAAAQLVRYWETVAELAGRHRVSGYVLRSSAQAGFQLPEVASHRLRAELLATQAVAMLLERELKRIVGALAADGVPVMVLKGPALVRMLYSDRALRPYADLDLTVRREDEARAAAVLRECTYRELFYEGDAARRASSEHFHEAGSFHRSFARVDDRALVELHLDPLQLALVPVCEEERWARARSLMDVPGAYMLAPSDQVVQLSVHAHKHGFNRLIWLKDLDLLLRTQHSCLDWPLIAAIARREGVTASVWYALELTSALLNTRLPTGAAVLCPSHPTRWLYSVVWPSVRVARLEGFVRRRAVQFFMDESWSGMLPSLLLMGRRRTRTSLILRSLLRH